MREYLTLADLVEMPNLGLTVVAGENALSNPVIWTHVSELEDPGPWLEGGELLVVNGFGIPDDAAGQVEYVTRLAKHRLAGLAVSVRAPQLSGEMISAANALNFPILKIPRQVPFIELSYLVASASEKSIRGRLSRHLRIFETLRLRNSSGANIAEIYQQLEQVSGYQLALLTPAGRPLLPELPRVPEGLDISALEETKDLQVTSMGYVIPLVVGSRVTAYLIGEEGAERPPGGLASLQHVSTIAVLDAIEDQRQREVRHRLGSALLLSALEGELIGNEFISRLVAMDFSESAETYFLAFEHNSDSDDLEILVRDWLADREVRHLLLQLDSLFALVQCDSELLGQLASNLGLNIGVSGRASLTYPIERLRSQAVWGLTLADKNSRGQIIKSDEQLGLSRWLNQDAETMTRLADEILQPVRDYDEREGTDLLLSLTVYFRHQGKVRPAAAELYVHEHTLNYRLRKLEKITGRDLRNYRDMFELWLAIESVASVGKTTR